MKKIHYLLLAVILTGAITSCRKGGLLDVKSTASLNQEITFADSANTMDFLANLYVDLSYHYTLNSTNTQADYSKMCDEAEGRYPALGNYDKVVTQGTFATNYFNQQANDWTSFYGNIRIANIFLANVDASPLSAAKKVRVKAEARFLRALYYFFLVRSFGGVPLVADNVFDTGDKAEYSRNTFEECVNYITGELDAAAKDLPLEFTGLDYGRVTKGACLALKARMLLYAASPLFNGGSTATSSDLIPLTAYPTFDQTRWEKARLAAKAVMDLGYYNLNVDNNTTWAKTQTKGYGFYKLFISRVNREFILPKPLPTGKQLETSMNPKSRNGANFYYYPTQELVDMFPTIKGLPITSDIFSASNPTGFNANDPYNNRDPRLTATVVYNQSYLFLNATKGLDVVNTYVGASQDGIVAVSSNTATITGYYTRKLQDEQAVVQGGSNVDRSLPIIRYAEILLNYAEAANEMGNTADALNTLIPLRQRAGITAGTDGRYGVPLTNNPDVARTFIQNERAVELAFEHHRWWDIRRWKLGALLDGKFVHGMQITKTGNNYTYKKIDIRTRYFKPIYYLFPIPKDDVTISLQKLLQNPGYDGVPIKP